MDKKNPFDELTARVAGMTSARADGIERGEGSLTDDLDERIADAAVLDVAGAELLGYDVRHAGRAKHKDVQPYAEGDPRAAAWTRGQEQALARVQARIGRLSGVLGMLGRLPDGGPSSAEAADTWKTEAVAILATETPLTVDQARGFVDAARDLDDARRLVMLALSVGIRTIGDYRRSPYV